MKSKPPSSQLLLLLPSEWLEELSILAKSRYISRLALIRSYLRQQMDKDFAQYSEQISEREKLLKTRIKLKTLVNDRN
jgi:hypothetical protein